MQLKENRLSCNIGADLILYLAGDLFSSTIFLLVFPHVEQKWDRIQFECNLEYISVVKTEEDHEL